MNRLTRYYMILLIIVIFSQVFILNRVDLFIIPEYAPYVLIYPLIYILLPTNFNRTSLILIAFGVGFFVDLSLGSLGVHSGASVLGAFSRKFVLRLFELRTGFSANSIPGLMEFDISWVIRYNAFMLFIHSIGLFTLEIFTFYFLLTILMKAIFTTLVSVVAVVMVQLLYKY